MNNTLPTHFFETSKVADSDLAGGVVHAKSTESNMLIPSTSKLSFPCPVDIFSP